jgi:hypothetical protein
MIRAGKRAGAVRAEVVLPCFLLIAFAVIKTPFLSNPLTLKLSVGHFMNQAITTNAIFAATRRRGKFAADNTASFRSPLYLFSPLPAYFC